MHASIHISYTATHISYTATHISYTATDPAARLVAAPLDLIVVLAVHRAHVPVPRIARVRRFSLVSMCQAV